jgi:hypothetical protein
MATVVQSTVIGGNPSDVNLQWYQFMSRDPVQDARAFGKGMVRVSATTTDASAGVFLNLATVAVSTTQTGFDFTSAGTVRTIKVKAYGKSTTGNTNLVYTESTFLVVCAATPVAAQAAAVEANSIDIGTTGEAVTCVVTSQQVTLLLAGKAATTLNWVIDVTVDDPIPLAA